MSTFIMLTRVSHEHLSSPQALENLEQEVMTRVRSGCPNVKWNQSYAVLGPYEYLDIFNAPDIETATKVSTLVRTYGHAEAEIWPATEWSAYKDLLHSLPKEPQKETGLTH